MKITARSRYAVRILVELGKTPTGTQPLHRVETSQGISAKFAKQIIQPLEARGFISSRRGARGGYRLAMDPAEISLLEVITTSGESVQAAPCLNGKENCDRVHQCGVHSHWRALNTLVRDFMTRTTIADIICEEKRLVPAEDPDPSTVPEKKD